MCSLRLSALLVLIGALAGCRVEIFVPEGGHVETQSGNFSCASGETCFVDVVDIFFDETFVAVPDEGYWFQQWNRDHRHFCGGTAESCRLYTSGFEGNPLLEAFLSGGEVFYLQPAFRGLAADFTHTVTPAGGRFEFLNGVVLEIPAGAVDEAVDLTLGKLNPRKVNRALNSHTNALSEKRFLGGFSASPTMDFLVPIIAVVPVLPPRSFELPLMLELEPAQRRHWVEPTALEYVAEKRVARVEISHFSDLATGAVDGIDPEKLEAFCTDPDWNWLSICEDLDDLQPRECLLGPAHRPPDLVCCRELSFTARSEASDFSSNRAGGACEAVSDRVTVTYHECALPDGSPAPAQSHALCEISPHCPRDGKVGFEVDIAVPPKDCFAAGESLMLKARVKDREGAVIPAASVSWRSFDQGVATVGLNGKVSAVGAGATVIEAAYSRECKDYSATVKIQVQDLAGRWRGTEVADERACDEGVNTYRSNVAVSHVGGKVTFSWGGSTFSGIKEGCVVGGFGSEREDNGVSFGTGGVTIAADGRSMSGSGTWTWKGVDPDTGQPISCDGSSRLQLKR